MKHWLFLLLFAFFHPVFSQSEFLRYGRVIDKETRAPLRADITVVNVSTALMDTISMRSESSGYFSWKAKVGNNYAITFRQSDGYLNEAYYFENFKYNPDTMVVEMVKPRRICGPTVFPEVSFDFNSAVLKDTFFLLKLVEFLDLNPGIGIQFSGQATDNEKNPFKLAEQRAQAAHAYLIDKGVNKNRVLSKDHLVKASNKGETSRSKDPQKLSIQVFEIKD